MGPVKWVEVLLASGEENVGETAEATPEEGAVPGRPFECLWRLSLLALGDSVKTVRRRRSEARGERVRRRARLPPRENAGALAVVGVDGIDML